MQTDSIPANPLPAPRFEPFFSQNNTELTKQGRMLYIECCCIPESAKYLEKLSVQDA